MGVNGRLIDPDLLRTTEHRITYDVALAPLLDPKTAHAQDKAKY
jgi:hypothetical protein